MGVMLLFTRSTTCIQNRKPATFHHEFQPPQQVFWRPDTAWLSREIFFSYMRTFERLSPFAVSLMTPCLPFLLLPQGVERDDGEDTSLIAKQAVFLWRQ